MPGRSSPTAVLLGTSPTTLVAQALTCGGPEGFCEAVRWQGRLRQGMNAEAFARTVWQVVPESDIRSASTDREEEA